MNAEEVENAGTSSAIEVGSPSADQDGSWASYEESDLFSHVSIKDSNVDAENIVVAVFDYEPRTEQDLSMKKGQTFEIIIDKDKPHSFEKEWLHARSITTQEEGYIPVPYVAKINSLEAQPWFFGNIDRVEATQKLLAEGNGPGSFLLRNTKRDSHMWSLSVRGKNEIKHYMISNAEGGYSIMYSDESFQGLIDLVWFYTRNQDGLIMPLLKPCVHKSKPTTKDLAYSTKDKWEINRSSLVLIKKLGQGYYGEVWEGLWNKRKPVAIKTFNKETTNKKNFLAEASIMKQLSHPNLVQLYAVCTDGDPIYIVTELMVNGNLLDYLRSSTGRQLTLPQLIYMAIQVTKGMYYLEQRKYVHRDLAARNVLVGEDYVVKVADFGFTMLLENGFYQSAQDFKLPVKWSAPEVIRRHLFSTKSDVWSFGILMIELVTYGQSPYPGMKNDQVIESIKEGYRIPCPKKCPKELYKIIMMCWAEEPARRPSFRTLNHLLQEYLIEIDEKNHSYTNFVV